MNINFDLTVTMGVIVTIVVSIVGWVHARQKRTDDAIIAAGRRADHAIEGVAERLDRHEGRIHAVEQTMQTLPGKDDLHGLSLAMAEIRGDLREVRASMKGHQQLLARIDSVVSRQEDHLMKGAGR